MADFVKAAFPWVAFGFAVSIILIYRSSKEKVQDNKK